MSLTFSRLPLGKRAILLLFIFFCSGFAALLYQVIWQRWLVYYTGASSLGISLIVSAFMVGLGVGYLAGGYLADRSPKGYSIRYFIWAELAIGAFALLSKPLIYDWLYMQQAMPSGSAVQMYFTLFLILLLPTFMMGLSLPLLSKAFELNSVSSQANYIGLLYFTNTLGAAVGAFSTSFLLVRPLGFELTIWVGALLNFLCATLAAYIYLAEKTNLAAPISMPLQNDLRSVPTLQPTNRLPPWLIQYFISGFMAISLEIIWFRMIETMMKPLAVTFSLMLAIYLFTMAIGTLAGVLYNKSRLTDPLKTFLKLQYFLYGYTALSVVLLLFVIRDVPAFRFLFDYFQSYDVSLAPSILVFTLGVIPLFLMAVPTFLMGFSFTLSQFLVQSNYQDVGRRVGWLQFTNIAGSTLGAWFVSLIGFNYLGTSLTLKLICATGFIYLLVGYRHRLIGLAYWLAGSFALLGALLLIPKNTQFWGILSGMTNLNAFILQEDETALSTIKTLPDGTSTVFVNGMGQSMFPYKLDETHIILGAMPVLIHPNPAEVCIIGLGSGSTLFNASGVDTTRRVDCYELIVNQPDALREYARRRSDSTAVYAINSPKVGIHLQDGRYALHNSDKKYDIIEADALRPRVSFSGNLYSVEYFQLMKKKLKPGGYAITWGATERITNSFKEVFPYVYLISGFMLLGSEQPVIFDNDALQKRLASPFTKSHYARAQINMDSLATAALRSVQPLQQGQVTFSIKRNSDMWPRDEYDLGSIWHFLNN